MLDKLEFTWRLSVVLFVTGLAACAGAHRAGPPVPADDPCAVGPPPPVAEFAAAGQPIAVGLPGPVHPVRAPVPRTDAERLVFAQLYRTLVRITCDGRVEPSVAASWRAEDEGRRWTFTLRSDVRDWEGAPVTAADVVASWVAAAEARADAAGETGAAGVAGPDPSPRFTSLGIRDTRTLAAELAEPVTAGFFSHPALAVRSSPGSSAGTSGWPNGTGPYRPRADGGPPGGATRSVFLSPVAGGAPLRFRTVVGDARDALEAGLDLLVTADPGAIDYAASTAAFLAVPLTWNRGYLFLASAATAGVGELPGPGERSGPDELPGEDTLSREVPAGPVRHAPETALAALARDAVRIEARPALDLSADLDACPLAPAAPSPRRPAGASPRDPRIVYPSGDAVARALAERLVALALAPRGPEAGWLVEVAPGLARPERDGAGARAVGLPERELAEALRAGRGAAFVLPVDRGPATDLCLAAGRLVARAPWLAEHGPAIVPLVETRSTLILRRGIGGAAVDGRGTLLLDGLRRSAEAGGSGSPEAGGSGSAEAEP